VCVCAFKSTLNNSVGLSYYVQLVSLKVQFGLWMTQLLSLLFITHYFSCLTAAIVVLTDMYMNVCICIFCCRCVLIMLLNVNFVTVGLLIIQ